MSFPPVAALPPNSRTSPDVAGVSSSTPHIEFYGAAGRVTGSCHILRCRGRTVLLDCGLIQGGWRDEAGNADPFPFDPAQIDAVVLSHAHLDHSGRLPLLVKRGFRGTIHAQNATKALIRILLHDAAGIEASNVRRDNRHRAERGQPMLEPLFTVEDVGEVLALTEGHRYHRPFGVIPGVQCTFADAGHIMGSAVIQLEIEQQEQSDAAVTRVVYSGDLGQYDSPILRDPESPGPADLVIMETTYGDRCHRELDASLTELGEIIHDAHRTGGNVLIPAFAVGRSQELLYQLGKHFDDWELKRWQIFLDSPLAIEASEIYWDFENLFDEEASEIFREREFMPHLPNLHFTRTADESKAINRLKQGAIIIAGSGMCNGGRILHHLRRDVGRKETQLVFTGYQPPGTLGRRIIDGAETVRIYGENYPVRATVHTIGGLSAHGDRDDLLRWRRALEPGEGEAPGLTYLVHGDPDATRAFHDMLADVEGLEARIARVGDRVDLGNLRR